MSTLFSGVVLAQTDEDYIEIVQSALKTEKKAVIAEVMKFTKEESKVFWPLYNEYQQALSKANTRSYNLTMDFVDNYKNMSDEQASKMLESYFSVDLEILKVRHSFARKFQKILSPQRTIKFYQVENKINALISFEIAQSVPLIETAIAEEK